MKHKKGISSLLITVLLIGFAVVLATLIFIWAGSFSKGVTEGTDSTVDKQMICLKDVNYDIITACYDGNKVNITVENKGNIDITNLTLRFYNGLQTAIGKENLDGLAKIQLHTYTVDLTGTGIDATQVNQIDAFALIKFPRGLSSESCEGKVEKYLDAQYSTTLQLCS
ncbi:MAG: archaellin/type IV pilin N-terminal domain-containing protein [Candidatus Woesearchaeota archaeon]